MKKENMKNTQSVIIGNDGNEPKHFVFVVTLVAVVSSLVLYLFANLVIRKYFSLNVLENIAVYLLFLMITIGLIYLFTSLTYHYIEIDLDNIQVMDTTIWQKHLNPQTPSAIVSLKDIAYVEVYAEKEQKIGELFGDPGHHILLKFAVNDGTSFTICNWIDPRNDHAIDGMDFLQNHGITIKDEQGLLNVLRNHESLNDYLNRRNA